MARTDPAQQALIRLEIRRFSGRCSTQEGYIQRADNLRELQRLAGMQVPYKLSNEPEAREALRRLLQAVEERCKELIQKQIDSLSRAEEINRSRLKSQMTEEWSLLSGGLGHLRAWATKKLVVAEQSLHH
jgi:hypothetical protein